MGRASVNISVVGQYSGRALERAARDMRNLKLSAAAELGGISSSLITGGAEWITYGTKIENAGKKIQDIGTSATKYLTVPIVGAGLAVAKSAIDIDSALTGVKKTVDGTEEEFQELKRAAIEFSETNFVKATDVLRAEELGGQLGIAKDNLQEFARITTGLDIATNMDVDSASTNLARFANIVKMNSSEYENYGNTIVQLGNNLATTESEISDMAMRIASAGSQAGMSASEILGFSGALSSLGMEAQAGGTAISRTIVEISKEVSTGGDMLEGYAKIAGMSAETFADAWKNDATGAMVAFIQGLANGVDAGEDMNVMLDSLGVNEIRQSDALRRLGGNTELLTDAIRLANDEWANGSALQDEVDNKNDSLEAKLAMLEHRVTGVAEQVGGPLVTSFLDILDVADPVFSAIKDGSEAFSSMDKEQQRLIIGAVGLLAAFGPVTTVVGKGVEIYGKGVKAVGKFNQSLGLMSAAAKKGKGDMTGLGASIGGFANKTKATSAIAQGAAKTLGVLSKAAIAGAGIFAGVMVAGMAASAVQTLLFADATKKANAAFEDSIANTTSFGALLSNTAPQVGDFANMVGASGRTIAELDQVIANAESGITNIISTAFSEQRTLRAEDIASINEYNEEVRQALQEKTDTYLTSLDGQYAAISAAEGELSAEQSAQRISNINAITDEALSSLEEGHNLEIASIQRKWEAVGLAGSQAHMDELAAQEDFYKKQVDAINSKGDEAISAATSKAEGISDSVVKEFAKIGQDVDTLYDNTHKTGVEWLDTMDVAFREFTGGTIEAKNEYSNALASVDTESASYFLSMLGTAKTSGTEITQEHKDIANAILSAYDDLPDSMDETAATSLKAMISGFEKELTGVSDVSGLTADQIVEKMREHLDLGTVSEEALADFANKFIEAEPTVSANSGLVASSALDPLTGKAWQFGQVGSEDAGAFSAGLSAEATNVSLSSGLLNSSAIDPVSGKASSFGLAGSQDSSAFSTGISSNASKTKSAAQTIADAAGGMKDVGDTYTWGSHAGTNFAAGLSSAFDVVNSAAVTIASAVSSKLKHTKPKEGPLSEGEELWGLHAGQNFADGMIGSVPDVRKAAHVVSGAAAVGLASTMQIGAHTSPYQAANGLTSSMPLSAQPQNHTQSFDTWKLDRIIELLENYMTLMVNKVDALANMNMVADTGALIGILTPGISRALGKNQLKAERSW